MTSAKVLADSVNQVGNRLTTFELTYPRCVHAELMTHRVFSRNTASSRAIPNAKLRDMVLVDPFVPDEWGSNQKGMQAGAPLGAERASVARSTWLAARDSAVAFSKHLSDLGVHKQLANRLLEPFQYITALVTATKFENWFHLRCHPDAQPQISELAWLMWEAYSASEPDQLVVGAWHLPLVYSDYGGIDDGEIRAEDLVKVSVGRCARVSYLTHDGNRDIQEDIRLHDDLVKSGHWSPFEHVAMALPGPYASGNFVGWHQYSKQFPAENVTSFVPPR